MAATPRSTVPSLLEEETDIQGRPLAPLALQPHTEDGVPLIRDLSGQLVDPMTGDSLAPSTPRFSVEGELLDAFNRPLPPGAVPMFDAKGRAIGVGPDGKHYTDDGDEISCDAPHFDSSGNQLLKVPNVVFKSVLICLHSGNLRILGCRSCGPSNCTRYCPCNQSAVEAQG
jgi:hypothetical protein